MEIEQYKPGNKKAALRRFQRVKKVASGHFFEICARSLVAALPAVPSRKEAFPAEKHENRRAGASPRLPPRWGSPIFDLQSADSE